MSSNKKRLYVALYPSGVVNNEERKYHWGLLIGPKLEKSPPVPGVRYHVKNRPVEGWIYEELPLPDVQNSHSLLARISIAKIEDEARLIEIIRAVPIIQGDKEWRCRTWVQTALLDIEKDGSAVGTAMLDWVKIETFARDYVGKKTAEGRYKDHTLVKLPRPTFSLLDNKEVVP